MTRQLAELTWARPDWRERAHAWIDAQLGGLGLTATGAVEEVKLRPWSAVLRAPTSGGDVYFKANLPALANEPGLTRLLARIDPVHVLPVLAEEPGERWMLQSDGGPTMRSRLDGHDDLRRWERMLGLYAELQVRASAHAEELLGARAPDRRPAELRGLFERLVDAERGLPASTETFSGDEHSRLRALAGRIEEMAAELDAFGLPLSVDHSDLHAGNVLARRLHDAYLDPWAEFGSVASLRAALDVALRVGPLTRALGWMRVIEGLPAAEQAEWAECVPGWLRDVWAELERR